MPGRTIDFMLCTLHTNNLSVAVYVYGYIALWQFSYTLKLLESKEAVAESETKLRCDRRCSVRHVIAECASEEVERCAASSFFYLMSTSALKMSSSVLRLTFECAKHAISMRATELCVSPEALCRGLSVR